MGRAPCCCKVGLNRGPWSIEEDKLLIHYIQTHGEGHWRALPSKAGLLRCGKSCRLRWVNYLRPGVKRGNFTSEENDTIIRLHSLHGNRWSLIAAEFPGRTDNEIKNHWNTHLRKKAALLLQNDQPNVVQKKNVESSSDYASSRPTMSFHSKVSSQTSSTESTLVVVESTKVVMDRSCEEEEEEDQQKSGGVDDHADYQPQQLFQNCISSIEQTKQPESTKVNLATPTSSGISYSSSTITTEGEVNMVTDTFFYELDDLIDVDQKINGCNYFSRDDDGTKQLERLYTEYLQLLNYGAGE